jgi:Rha family phage regulatory protein
MTAIPTKSELINVSLVAIDQHHKKVITSTVQIADYFGKRPSNVNQRITSLVKRGRLNIKPSYYLNSQGKEQVYYKLNRDQFLLVVMGFTGEKADRFKADFIQLFNQQEAELIEWQQGRLIAIDTTKQANHQIYWLQNELKSVIPDSLRCKMLFVHLQQGITKAVTGKANTPRGSMTSSQLLKIGNLEEQVEANIEQLKREGLPALTIRDEVLASLKAA